MRAIPRALPPALGVAAIWLFLLLFLVYPLLRILYDAFSDEAGRLTLANFVEFARDPFYFRSLVNSLVLGLGTVAATSLVGFAVAFLLVRYEFVGRNLFGYLTLIPIISPPLVGVLGFTFIMGRAGTVNVLLEDWFGLAKPINFVYGIHGVLLVETLHLFPMITLNVVDALAKIDPALEEAAESVGARGFAKWRTITLPLTTPGYVAGALLVFIWTFSDFATPLVLGVHDLLAAQAYLNIVQFVDRRIFRMGIVISALMVALAVVFLVAARRYVAIKDYSSLSYSRLARVRLSPLRQAAAVAFLTLLMLLSFVPYLGLALASVGKGWSLTPFPARYTLQYFERVIVETPKYVVNSRVPLRSAVAPPRPHELLDRAAARPRDPAAPVHGPRRVRVAAARAPLHGGGRGERRRHGRPLVPGRDAAAHLARRARRIALLVHDVAPGGVGRALPLARRVGDDHGRDLRLLHRGERERGRRARRHPHRRRRGEPGADQPRRGSAHGGNVRLDRATGGGHASPHQINDLRSLVRSRPLC